MPQLNRTNLLNDIITNIFNNITKFITGNNAQQRMVNMVDSVPNILSDKDQPDGYVGTDANNEMLQNYVRENQLLISLQILATGGDLVPGKAYIINDAVGGSAELYVRAADGSNLHPQALNLTTGTVGTYVLATDTYTPIAGSGTVMSVTGNIVDNTDPANPVVDAVYVKDADGNVYYDGVQAGVTLGTGSVRNVFHQNISVTAGDGFTQNTIHQRAVNNIFGDAAANNVLMQAVTDLAVGDTFQFCTIHQALNFASCDLITNATLIYGRSLPWEILSVDDSNNQIYVRWVDEDPMSPTYLESQEGWYNYVTDTFTPVAAGDSGIFGVSVIPNPSSTLTGTTSETSIARIEIAPADWAKFDIAIMKGLLNKTTGTGATLETRIRIGNNPTFTSNALVRTISLTNTAFTGLSFEAHFNRVGNDLNFPVNSTANVVSDVINTATSNTYALDFTQTIYIDWSVVPGITGMTTTLRHFTLIPISKAL